MKKLILQNLQPKINELLEFLVNRGVVVTSVLPLKIMFQPSSLMKQDINALTKELDYSYAPIPNVTYPTKILSDNGKDDEYYLNTTLEDSKLVVVVNATKGIITFSEQ